MLTMSVRQIATLTGLDEDTVRHRLATLMQRTFVTEAGICWPIVEIARHASKGRVTAYRLNVPRYMGDNPNTIVTRSERLKWEREGSKE